ncbi:DUF937 domain-containing protein [Rhizobium sp. YIM 134829]|uniref:DUF937 domain-containing protein n=1 Tax=Rhizobium sp. YIM 134829 TaxID=3390453 RepID=UPI00397D32E9
MIPLFDMMMQAQDGRAIDIMAKQYGLAQEQMARAMAALMPAFSAGLKSKAANPYDFTTFLAAISQGNYARYFEDMTKAFTPQGLADGNAALLGLFGSPETARAVAEQAARLTGIGQEIYQSMMPVVANALMGGLFKQATGQMKPSAPDANPFGAAMQNWLEAAGFARKPEQAAPLGAFDNPFTQAMQAFFTAPKASAKPTSTPDPFALNPFLKAFQDMVASTAKGAGQAEPEKPQPKAPAVEMFSAMFESGLEVQKEYQKAIDGLFAGFTARKG